MTIDLGTAAILYTLLLLLSGLGFTVWIDPYIRRDQRRTMLIIVVLCFSLIAQNYWDNELFVRHSNRMVKNILDAYGYSARPVILILFLKIVFPEGEGLLYWVLAGINTVLYFSSPFTKLCFEIKESNHVFHRRPLWFCCFLLSGLLLALLLVRTMIRYWETRRIERLIPVAVAIMIVVSVVLDMNIGPQQQPITFLTISVVTGSVFYYIWLHLQFVREHEQDLVAAQRIQIMMTQIQPHFLFNALNTIRALYARDTALANRTLENFSTYLRQNLESLSQTGLIPFRKELEHTRMYAEIEVLRFPNVRIEYQIEDEGFRLPALTIQPLVENAIRHGVRSCKDGLVTISTVREADVHRITVRDNGAGFDIKAPEIGGETHIAIRNVRERVEQMCGGTMILESRIGKGTCVTLLIPENDKRQGE